MVIPVPYLVYHQSIIDRESRNLVGYNFHSRKTLKLREFSYIPQFSLVTPESCHASFLYSIPCGVPHSHTWARSNPKGGSEVGGGEGGYPADKFQL